jgi:chromosome partitioning protein
VKGLLPIHHQHSLGLIDNGRTMKQVIFNQKGGVGKSTISTNLAAQSALLGYKTLLVDLDAQGNSTHYAGVDLTPDVLTVADMFKQIVGWFSKPRPAQDFVQQSPFTNLYVLPASPALNEIERELESRYKMFKLRDTLKALEAEFEHIYIDTPPNFNFYSKAALIAANEFIVPFDCDHFSAQAIDHLLHNILEIKEDHNQDLKFAGVVINQYNSLAKLPKALIEDLRNKNLPLFETYLSSSVKIKESHSQRRPMPFFMPSHKVSKQFAALFAELSEEGVNGHIPQ